MSKTKTLKQKPPRKEEERSPVIRPRTPKEELARLHPFERFLYRCFEFLSSVKLAAILIAWITIEFTIGMFVESRVNASTARYFVYGNTRFMIALALISLNILFAALIRFPWKAYQIGFLVTHAGLLIILSGFLVQSFGGVDSLLSVQQGRPNSAMVDPSDQVLKFALEDPATGKTKRHTVNADFGPFTWGDEILGFIPWRAGHEQVIPLDELQRGLKLRVKRYVANCDPRDLYVADPRGGPAVEFELSVPNFAMAETAWLGARGAAGRTWELASPNEVEHFVHAFPQGEIDDSKGIIGVSLAGEHHLLRIEELERKAFEDPKTGAKIELANWIADIQQLRGQAEGMDPSMTGPLVMLRLTWKGETKNVFALADAPERAAMDAKRAGLGDEVLITFFRSDQPTEMQFGVTTDGRLAYRAFGQKGGIVSTLAEIDKYYPSIGPYRMRPRTVLPHARRVQRELVPKAIVSGEETFPGIEVEIVTPDGQKVESTLIRRLAPTRLRIGDKILSIDYNVEEEELPFVVGLDLFNEPKQPGTQMAAAYESFVTLYQKTPIDKSEYRPSNPLHIAVGDNRYELKEQGKASIYMNHPLKYKLDDGRVYTLFQSGIQRLGGDAVSTYTVSYDPGLKLKYAGSIVLITGVFLFLVRGGYFRSRAGRLRPPSLPSAKKENAIPEPVGAA